MGTSHRRKVGLITAVVMIVGLFAAPASATKPDPESDLVEGHKIWICHATRSLTNPYVKILIDIAAWDVEDPDNNDHGPVHHERTKDGVTWADYALDSEDDECSLDEPPPPPPPTGECPNGDEADFVVDFQPRTQLLTVGPTTQTVSASIPAGTYDLTLLSGDDNRPTVQLNERWRLLGSVSSGFSDDLPDVPLAPISGDETTGLSVTFNSDVSTVTAEHWSVTNTSNSANSVIPEFACLTRAGAGG